MAGKRGIYVEKKRTVSLQETILFPMPICAGAGMHFCKSLPCLRGSESAV